MIRNNGGGRTMDATYEKAACVECGKSFTDVQRYKDSNLCETCISKPVESKIGFLDLASKSQRIANYVLDALAYSFFCLVMGGFVGIVLAVTGLVSDFSNMEKSTETLLGYLIGMPLIVLYYFLTEGLTGRSLAKYITGTRVVTLDGKQPNIWVILKRTLCRFIPFDALSFLLGEGWHDTISKTCVINVEKKAKKEGAGS